MNNLAPENWLSQAGPKFLPAKMLAKLAEYDGASGWVKLLCMSTGINACRRRWASMDEDLSAIFELVVEEERRRRYLKEFGGWLIDEEFEPNQAS
jgi:hypothetical protein